MQVRVNIPWLGRMEALAAMRAVSGMGARPDVALSHAIEQATGLHVLGTYRSGRAGLVAVLEALGVRGGRVLVPAYVCPAVLAAVAAVRVEPVFVDVEPDSFRFDMDALRDQVRATKATVIIAANTYGHDQDFAALQGIGLPIIDDAAYQGGLPSRQGAELPGARGALGIWSFNFKALAGIGGGLVVAAAQPQGLPRASRLEGTVPRFRGSDLRRTLGYVARSAFRERIPRWLPGFRRPEAGREDERRFHDDAMAIGRMSWVQAAVALSLWRRRDVLQARYLAANHLLERTITEGSIGAWVRPVPGGPYPHLYPMLVTEHCPNASRVTMRIRQEMHTRGVQTEEPYPIPRQARARCPNSVGLRERLILIPVSAAYDDRVQRHVAEAFIAATRLSMASGHHG